MTIKEAIRRADEIRPNTTVSDDVKYHWLFELEKEIAELFGVPLSSNPYPADGGLLLPFPDDEAYVYFLCAKIDYVNQDTVLYQNDFIIYQAFMSNVRARYRRDNFPRKELHIKTM